MTEKEKACNRWLNLFFSWEEKEIPVRELDAAREGFLAGAAWAESVALND